MSTNKILRFGITFIAVFSMFSSVSFSEWEFSWDVRTDRDGKPAGIYETTPYPIDETSTSYTITNDDGTKTYELGTKYYVDVNSLLYVKKNGANYELYFGSGTNQLVLTVSEEYYKTWMRTNASLNPQTL